MELVSHRFVMSTCLYSRKKVLINPLFLPRGKLRPGDVYPNMLDF